MSNARQRRVKLKTSNPAMQGGQFHVIHRPYYRGRTIVMSEADQERWVDRLLVAARRADKLIGGALADPKAFYKLVKELLPHIPDGDASELWHVVHARLLANVG